MKTSPQDGRLASLLTGMKASWKDGLLAGWQDSDFTVKAVLCSA